MVALVRFLPKWPVNDWCKVSNIALMHTIEMHLKGKSSLLFLRFDYLIRLKFFQSIHASLTWNRHKARAIWIFKEMNQYWTVHLELAALCCHIYASISPIHNTHEISLICIFSYNQVYSLSFYFKALGELVYCRLIP